MSKEVLNLGNIFRVSELAFEEMAQTHKAVTFAQECGYAKQLIDANSFLRSVAERNIKSLQDAILNVASIGISLSPVTKHAYLVPRKGRVCLDVSYMGLCHLAQESGAIRYVQAELVFQKDTFQSNGVDQMPTFKSNPFGDRGDCVGAFCVAKTSDGDYLTETMSLDEILLIRDKSESYKNYINKNKSISCVWVDHFGEMAKKTVVKRASKMWPKSKRSVRLDKAIFEDNIANEIEFEEKPVEEERRDYTAIRKLNEQILALCQVVTADMTAQDKIKFAQDVLGVKKDFKELIKKTEEELQEIVLELESMKSTK